MTGWPGLSQPSPTGTKAADQQPCFRKEAAEPTAHARKELYLQQGQSVHRRPSHLRTQAKTIVTEAYRLLARRGLKVNVVATHEPRDPQLPAEVGDWLTATWWGMPKPDDQLSLT